MHEKAVQTGSSCIDQVPEACVASVAAFISWAHKPFSRSILHTCAWCWIAGCCLPSRVLCQNKLLIYMFLFYRGHLPLAHTDCCKPSDDSTGAGAYAEEPPGTRAGSSCSFHTLAGWAKASSCHHHCDSTARYDHWEHANENTGLFTNVYSLQNNLFFSFSFNFSFFET